jgi:hypothetical protein
MSRTILSLCDYTGTWSKPYRDAGYEVIQVDIKHGDDVRLFKYPGKVHGIIAQPPCQHFAGSGARWWKSKGDEALIEALALVDACLRFVTVCQPEWWVLENPVGRLIHYIGPWQMNFHPHEYAGWADDPGVEAYTKKTCLWGRFTTPEKKDVGDQRGSIILDFSPTEDPEERRAARSVTPTGFARAFYEANP